MKKQPHIIMEDSNDQQVDDQTEAAAQVEQTEDTTDWKAKAIEYETKYKSENGIRRRLEKDLKQRTTPATETSTDTQPQNKKGFDYGQLAYLESKGVSDSEDHKYLEDLVKESGTELRDLLGKSWVQAELKERKELRASKEATPSGSKRSGNAATDSVDYWVAKINQGKATIKDIPDRELRYKVLNARIKKETQTDVFYDS